MKRTTAVAGSRPRVCGLSLAIAELTQSRRTLAKGGALLASAMAIVPVSSVVAQDKPANDQQLEEVRKKVSAALKKDAVMHQYVDEKIIGGLVLRVQDRLLDGSVKAQLDALHRQMLMAKAK